MRSMNNNKNDQIDLNFDGHNTLYATHGLHSFAAKCPPQLAKFGIENYSTPGDFILDPMAGSGTTLVEASLCGRNSLGFDLDPLSCLIARVKTRLLDDKQIEEASVDLIYQARLSIKNGSDSRDVLKYIPQNYPNLDYWFEPGVKTELAAILMHICESNFSQELREFFLVAFSSIILSKVSVANARDIIHSRHHYFHHNTPPIVLEKFERRILRMRRQIQEYSDLLSRSQDIHAVMVQGDARNIPIEDSSIDLIFTSPPYATALDYTRAHFLAIGWLQMAIGLDLLDYKRKGAEYIGSERGKIPGSFSEEHFLENYPELVELIGYLKNVNERQSNLIKRYFLDMNQVMKEMHRVLKPSKWFSR